MTTEPDMALPEGNACDDCGHIARCVAFGFTWRERTSCDFSPSRYKPRVLPAPPPAKPGTP